MKTFFVALLLGIFIGSAITAYFNSPESFRGMLALEKTDAPKPSEKMETLKEAAKDTLEGGKEKAARLAENVKEKGQDAIESSVDLKIAIAIRGKFKLDQEIESDPIRIDVKDGLVTLSGTVPDYDMARRAIEKAAEAEGVKGVESNLEVAKEGG